MKILPQLGLHGINSVNFLIHLLLLKEYFLQMNLLSQRLNDYNDVLEYIFRVENIHQDIIKGRYGKLEDSILISILINGLPESYKHFIEILKIIINYHQSLLTCSVNY